MADSGFPNQHTTTTTTTNTAVITTARFDSSYVRTVPGLLKCIQIMLNLIGFICIEASGYWATYSRGNWFTFVSMAAFWFTGILLVLYLFHFIEKFYRIPWLKIELVYCAIWAVFYLIASCLAATFQNEAYRAAAFFGFCAMVAYAVDAYLKFRSVQNGEIAQGERVVHKQTTTSTVY